MALLDEPASDLRLATSLVHYAMRAQESVLVDDASHANPFSSDAYSNAPAPSSACPSPAKASRRARSAHPAPRRRQHHRHLHLGVRRPDRRGLNEVTRELIALATADLQRDRVVLQLQLVRELPTVSGDRVQLQQVILNLIRNAAEAMVEVHDRARALQIRTESVDAGVLLTVRDAGMGFSAEDLGSLFDAFHTIKDGGMGIGLFVSRSILDQHRGRLWAEPNSDGPGATFYLQLPSDNLS